ncbi:hypothetical protein HDU83_007008 [Entophlyctis luteolus]|nr:hypothetical protein HDU83_007008 [Entophlyctis luteolus]KAJ3379593.1 hypothetical protein HDU84_006531 [Entophlyctis sp. JEL0112]
MQTQCNIRVGFGGDVRGVSCGHKVTLVELQALVSASFGTAASLALLHKDRVIESDSLLWSLMRQTDELVLLAVDAGHDPKLVIAHYMIIFPIYGVSVDSYIKEIEYAQRLGIDGFAINVQPPLMSYVDRVTMIYEAARQIGSKFWLCLSLDMGYKYESKEIVNYIARFALHPHQLKIYQNGVQKTFVTTFRGESSTFGFDSVENGWVKGVIEPLAAAGIPIHFVPNFWVHFDDSIYSRFEYVDGVFNWRCCPNLGHATDVNMTKVARCLQKTYMASVTPWFYKHNDYGNWFQGNYDMVDRWMQLVKIRPMMIEIVTWNDFSESTYIGSYDPNVWRLSNGELRSVSDHEAFGVLGTYFIRWYKTGVPPPIDEDKVFFWFRPHSSAATAKNDPLGLPSWLEQPYEVPLVDQMYGVVFLVDDADVSVESGPSTTLFSFPQGIHKLPFSPAFVGRQSVSVFRRGEKIKSVVAKVSVCDDIETYNFNVFAAYG